VCGICECVWVIVCVERVWCVVNSGLCGICVCVHVCVVCICGMCV